MGRDGRRLTCIRLRMTWYGYVHPIAISLADPDMRMYSVLLCKRAEWRSPQSAYTQLRASPITLLCRE